MSWLDHVEESKAVLSDLCDQATSEAVASAVRLLVAAAKARKPILVCGNGGSAADSMHFAAELVGRFRRGHRAAVRCLSLAADPVFLTAWANDVDFDDAFRRQVEAHGEPGGVFVAITTSGSSRDVLAAHAAALNVGMSTIALTGAAGLNGQRPTVLIAARSISTALVQQAHQVVYHHLAARTEDSL